MNERLIRLCVIDDVSSVVEMIASRTDWASYGIEIAGTAGSGVDGLRLVEEVRPDIVLTDIRMPKMDGMEMTARILQLDPHCKVIILSGYTDFEYAQQAIRLGAFDFLKKPFSRAEIVKVVVKAKEAWEEERRSITQVHEMEKRLMLSMPLLRQEYLSTLVHHRTDAAQAERRWRYFHIPLEPRRLVVMIVEIDRFEGGAAALSTHEVELNRFALQNILEETIQSYTQGVVFREADKRHICILNCDDPQLAGRIADRCCAHIAQYTRFTISIGIGLIADDPSRLPESYEQALQAFSYHFYSGGNGAFSYAHIAGVDKEPRFTAAAAQELLFALRSGNREKSLEQLAQLLDDLFAGTPKPDYVISVCYELAFMMLRVLLEKLPDEQVRELERRVRENKAAEPTMHELRQLLGDICRKGCEWVEMQRSSESELIVRQAMQYIRGNLGQALTVEMCARHANLSAGYFANVFKKIAGMTVQQYATHERIERAKQMLIEDFQVQEIADALGYEHRRYFSEVFKKTTGLTPSEFRQAYLGKA
ncbi:response regulator [Paenibacillus cymbidii]|uniref:response regulator n=1 Tax=Paenibacillus cymbidii TaxID=1639034 RepID=UPI0010815AB5|nr:response regulator [Paenibacillus cymbidii]